MSCRTAAFAALVLAIAVANAAAAEAPVTLDDAFARVAENHPDLRLIGVRRELLGAELDRAGLRPPLVAGANIENALGSGNVRAFKQAELTLSLASVLERGGKLDSRRILAQSRIDALAVERESRRLDILAEVARRYLALTVATEQRDIADLDLRQRSRVVAAANKRHRAGASPESVVFSAQAAQARSELERARAEQRIAAARQYLAALWGERDPLFEIAAGDPLRLPEVPDFQVLSKRLEATPELTWFVGEQRVREARLQLARSESSADLTWQLGVRRLQAGSDFGLVGSVSIPLGASHRAEPGIRAAQAELASVEIERESKGLSLYSTLAEAHGRYRIAQLDVSRLEQDVIPKLDKAEAAAERAFLAGASSYLEWAQLQSEQVAARRQQLESALEGQRALIEIQRLTGESFVEAPSPAPLQGTYP